MQTSALKKSYNFQQGEYHRIITTYRPFKAWLRCVHWFPGYIDPHGFNHLSHSGQPALIPNDLKVTRPGCFPKGTQCLSTVFPEYMAHRSIEREFARFREVMKLTDNIFEATIMFR